MSWRSMRGAGRAVVPPAVARIGKCDGAGVVMEIRRLSHPIVLCFRRTR
jgi:hypothetical protein